MRIIISILLLSVCYPDIKLSVNILRTGQYNVEDFLDPSINLFSVIAECIDCPEEGIDYRLEVKLNFNDINPAIWGVTYVRTLTPGMIDLLTDSDFSNTQSIFSSYFENEDFIAQLEETFYLPAGNVELSVKAYEACPFSPTWMDDFSLDCNPITSDDSHSHFSIFSNVVFQLTLLTPANNEDVLDSYPLFRWESPGFMEGVRVDYKLFVYKFDPVYHSTYFDAIEDENSLYFSTEITEIETGLAHLIQVQYPFDSDKDLTNGYTYIWYVEAQDIIEDSPFNGVEGLWGWPEPISSPLYIFHYDRCSGCECDECGVCEGDGIEEGYCDCESLTIPEEGTCDCEGNLDTCEPCPAIDPGGYGVCTTSLGYAFTGFDCEMITGCGYGLDEVYFADSSLECRSNCPWMDEPYDDCIYDCQNCKIINPDEYGDCEMVLGWGWTGNTCEVISGCGTGDDSPWFYDNEETCDGRCSFMNLSTETVELPHEYTLSSYPNPFNPTTTIFFSIPEFGFTTITVYDITGIELETLTNEVLSIGNYSINWNANDHSSGVYLIKMNSGDFTQIQKVTLVK